MQDVLKCFRDFLLLLGYFLIFQMVGKSQEFALKYAEWQRRYSVPLV